MRHCEEGLKIKMSAEAPCFCVRQYLLCDDRMGEKRIDAYFDIIQM